MLQPWIDCKTWPDRLHLLYPSATGCIDLDDESAVEAVFDGLMEGYGRGREGAITVPMRIDSEKFYGRSVILAGDNMLIARPGVVVGLRAVGTWTQVIIKFNA